MRKKKYDYWAEKIFPNDVLNEMEYIIYESRSFGSPTSEEFSQQLVTIMCLLIRLTKKVDFMQKHLEAKK